MDKMIVDLENEQIAWNGNLEGIKQKGNMGGVTTLIWSATTES